MCDRCGNLLSKVLDALNFPINHHHHHHHHQNTLATSQNRITDHIVIRKRKSR